MNLVLYYAAKILAIAGFARTSQQLLGMVVVGLTNMLATLIAVRLVARWGRKPMLLTIFLVTAIGMGMFIHNGIHSVAIQYTAIVMLLLFIVGFAMAAGSVIWLLCSEVQPMKGRDFGITISTTTPCIANRLVGATFLTLLKNLDNTNTFWLYGGLNLLFVLVALWLVPETKTFVRAYRA